MSLPDLAQLRQKIEASSILSEAERKEWLYLLPRMNEEQIKELERILSVKLPASPTPSLTPSPQVGEGRDRGISPHEVFFAAQKHTATPPRQHPPPQSPPQAGGSLKASATLPPSPSELAKLKSLSVFDLRQSSSPQAFFTEVRSAVKNLLERNTARLEQIAKAFDQSPLQKAYLDSGWKIMENAGGAELTQQELEAMTDFRASLRKILA